VHSIALGTGSKTFSLQWLTTYLGIHMLYVVHRALSEIDFYIHIVPGVLCTVLLIGYYCICKLGFSFFISCGRI